MSTEAPSDPHKQLMLLPEPDLSPFDVFDSGGGDDWSPLTDGELKEGGLDRVTAWVRSERSREELAARANALRQARLRERAEAEGLRPLSVGLVPVDDHDAIKDIARALRDGDSFAAAVRRLVPPPELPEQWKKIRTVLRENGWRARLIRWAAKL